MTILMVGETINTIDELSLIPLFEVNHVVNYFCLVDKIRAGTATWVLTTT